MGKNTKLTPEEKALLKRAFAITGRMGGKAGTGAAKRRTPEFYKRIGAMGAAKRHKKKKPKPKPTNHAPHPGN